MLKVKHDLGNRVVRGDTTCVNVGQEISEGNETSKSRTFRIDDRELIEAFIPHYLYSFCASAAGWNCSDRFETKRANCGIVVGVGLSRG